MITDREQQLFSPGCREETGPAVHVTCPRVRSDEVKGSVRTITGVPTSAASFVGYAPRGPVDRPVHVMGRVG